MAHFKVRQRGCNGRVPIYALGDLTPSIHPTAFVHPDAVVIGDVAIGAESTVWPSAVLRGDHGPIRVGDQTSIQDGTVVHASASASTEIGSRCVVGHIAHLEGCVVEDDCMIGSGSVVLHNVVVGRGSLVAAQALVTVNTIIPPRSRAIGVPARITAGVVEEGAFDAHVAVYVRDAHWYRADLRRLD
jgi:acetyltransferase-like isoleucine patch superfamily enzyme